MKYEDIKKSLQQVMLLIEQCEHDGVSAIEYDLMLNRLRDIYAAVRFELQPAAATSATAEENAAEFNAEITPAAVVIAEPAVTVEPQEEQQTEPEPKEEEQMTEQESQSEETAQQTGEEEEPETEKVAEIETEQSSEEAEEPEAPVFFKSDEETQNRRRMIVRSLYDAPVSEPTEHTATAEQTKEEIHETIAVYEPAAETDQSAEENNASVADTVPEEPKDEQPEVAKAEDTAVALEVSVAEVEETEDKAPAAEEPAHIEKAEEHAIKVEEHHFAAESATEHVLGEVINANVQTFADTIAPAETAAADIVGKGAIDDLSAAIGINDRFLMIRDLFDGNADAYNAAVQKLNSFDNLNDCMVYIVENFEWNPYCDGAKLMMSLIERRYAHNQ